MYTPKNQRTKKDSWTRKSNDGLQSNNSQNTEASLSGIPSFSLAGVRSGAVSEMGMRKADTVEALVITQKSKEERIARKQEMLELQEIWDKKMQMMKGFNEAKTLKAKWARYMKCDGSPDPVNQREINTYISLRLEDKSREDAENVLNDIKLDLQLIEEINFLLLDSSLEVLPEEERSVYQKTIDELYDLITYKLDMATLHVLCDATVLANKETGNLQHAVMIDDVALCVWGNIMKNPRIRSFEFAEINYTFDIPRIIALTDCAIRVLSTKFDHYSPTSKTIIPRLKKVEELEEEIKVYEEVQENEEENKDEIIDKEEDNEYWKPSRPDASSIKFLVEDGENVEVEEQEEVVEDFVDPPTPEPSEWEDFDEDDDIVDLRAFSVVGSIFQFNLLQLPPQPKYVKAWTISQLVDPPAISYLEYTTEPASHLEGNKEMKRDEKPPIALSLVLVVDSLPSDVLCLEQPQIALWDYEKKMWTTQGLLDITYNEETLTVAFKTNHFGTFCLLQDTHINIPFQSWEIRPRTPNSAVFTVTSSFIEIQIEIKDEYCCLNGNTNRPELESIWNKWVTPAELIVMMKKAGANIFPNEDSVKFVSVHNKHPLVEERLYQQIALTASAIAYSWSQWNGKLSDTTDIFFQAAEALEDEPVPEEAWSVFMASKLRVYKLILMEAEELMDELKLEESFLLPEGHSPSIRASMKPSRTPHLMRMSAHKPSSKRTKVKEGGKSSRQRFIETFNIDKSLFKSNMYHLMLTFASEKAVTRVNSTNFQFVNCVHKLLTATKVLTYS